MLADVAVDVRVDEILGWNLPAGDGGFELIPILGAIDCERGKIAGRAGLTADPAQGEGAFAVRPENRSVAGKLQIDFGIGRAFHMKNFALLFHVAPAAFRLVLKRVGGIEFFDVQILLIETENGEAPGDVFIVAERDAGESGFARSGDVPAGGDEVNHIAERRQADDAVRIVGEQGLAGSGEGAGDCPVVAAFAGVGGELNAMVAADEIFE